jgi:probable F420-dependent oxidoreductase
MQLGVVFPNDTIEPDAGAIREYVRAVEAMGFSHILSYDHVIGANRASRPGWQGYDLDSKFHEPVALLSWIAGATSRIGLATGVMILPQRQAVLVAKQAATLDLLSGGRLRLGVGTGWNTVEYEALGVDFTRRGRIFDEQIDLLRALWTERAVSFAGQFHTVNDAGLFPMPIQRPIPLWLGGGGVHPIKGWGHVDTVLSRIARKADGWLPTFDPDDAGAELVARMRHFASEAGREPADIPIEALLLPLKHPDWIGHIRKWQRLGASRMVTNISAPDVVGVSGNLRRLEEIRAAMQAADLWEGQP